MKKQVEGVREKILAVAQQEFLTCGFNDASLRRICAASGVSTHSLYTRFGDKAGLFDALVKEAADGLLQVYLKSLNSMQDCHNYSDFTDLGANGTEEVLGYIYQHFTEFKLIFCCSAGTVYAGYLDRLSGMEEKAYRQMIRQLRGDLSEVDDFFVHVACAGAWNPIYEIVSHDISFEKAKRFMELEMRYHYAGCEAVMGLL